MAGKSLTASRLKKATASLTSRQAINFDPIAGGIALVVVDIQPQFCSPEMPGWLQDLFTNIEEGKSPRYNPAKALMPELYVRGNKETQKAAEEVARLAPEFRKAGLPLYAIYVDHACQGNLGKPLFHVFQPADKDTLFPKNATSAFKSSLRKKFPHLKTFNQALSENSIKTIVICGVNEHACVAETAKDARKKGYNVILLTDAVADDNEQKFNIDTNKLQEQKMKDAGVIFMSSAEALTKIQAAQKKAVM